MKFQGNQSNFWVFLGWLAAGILLLAVIPGQYRYWLIVLIILAGLGVAYKNNPNFVTDIQSIFEAKSNNNDR